MSDCVGSTPIEGRGPGDAVERRGRLDFAHNNAGIADEDGAIGSLRTRAEEVG